MMLRIKYCLQPPSRVVLIVGIQRIGWLFYRHCVFCFLLFYALSFNGMQAQEEERYGRNSVLMMRNITK